MLCRTVCDMLCGRESVCGTDCVAGSVCALGAAHTLQQRQRPPNHATTELQPSLLSMRGCWWVWPDGSTAVYIRVCVCMCRRVAGLIVLCVD